MAVRPTPAALRMRRRRYRRANNLLVPHVSPAPLTPSNLAAPTGPTRTEAASVIGSVLDLLRALEAEPLPSVRTPDNGICLAMQST